MSAGSRGGKRVRHLPLLEVVYLRKHLCVANVFDDVLDALHFELGVCCEETDGDELGTGRTGSGFGALRCGCGQGRTGWFGCVRVHFLTLSGGWSESSGAGESEEEARVSDMMGSLARFLLRRERLSRDP